MNDKNLSFSISIKEAGEIEDKAREKRIEKGKWGAWYFTKNKKYFGINRLYAYEIEVSRLKSEGLIKWLAHLRHKTWMQRGDIEDLLSAFDDMFDSDFDIDWMYEELNAAREK